MNVEGRSWRRDLLCVLAGVLVASAVLVLVGWLQIRAARQHVEAALEAERVARERAEESLSAERETRKRERAAADAAINNALGVMLFGDRTKERTPAPWLDRDNPQP